jgi:hypothetical protein
VDSRWQLRLRYGSMAALLIAMACSGSLSSVRGAQGDSVTIAQTSGPLPPVNGPLWAPLKESNSGTKLRPDSLRQLLTRLHLRVVVKEISAEAQPGTAFNIYLGLMPSSVPAKDDPHFVGRFWLYNEINAGSLKATPSVRVYDIRPSLERSLARGALGDTVGVTIAPERTPAPNANVTIGSIAIVTP